MNIEKNTRWHIKPKLKLSGLSLTQKALFMITLCIILPVIIISYSYIYYYKQATLQNTLGESEAYTRQIINNLDNYLMTYRDMATIRYLDRSLRDYVLYDYDLDTIEGMRKYIDAYSYIDNMIGSMIATREEIIRATLFVQQNTLPTANYDVQYIDKQLEEKLWYQKLQSSRTGMILTVEYDSRRQKEIIYMSSFLGLGDLGYPYGIILFEIDREKLMSKVFPGKYRGEIYVYDYEGNIILTTDKHIHIHIQTIETYLIAKEDKRREQRVIKMQNREKQLIVNNLESNDFGIVNIIDKENYAKEVNKKIMAIQSILILIIIFFLSMVFASTQIFAKGVRTIISLIQEIDAENLEIKIENKRKDEIGVIIDCILDMAQRIHNLIEKDYKRELKLKQSELDILQEQLNPHFLYNTLGSLQALILKEDKNESLKLIRELSSFYRLCLNKGLSTIRLEDELKLIETYINIQNIRFRNTIHYQVDIEDEDIDFRLPKLLLQPFIENSIQHGKRGIEEILKIRIQVGVLDEQRYAILIEDDGGGIGESMEGYGLKNVRKRLELYFEEASLEVQNIVPHGTRISMVMRKISG